jgi:transporter family-2 protein
VTLAGLVMGQLLLSVVIDHYGLLNTPRIEVSIGRILGVVLLIAGAILVVRK